MKALIKTLLTILVIIIFTSCHSRNELSITNPKNNVKSTDSTNSMGVARQEILSDSVYLTPDVNATFIGGDSARVKFFNENLRFPKQIKDSINKGKVLLAFIVELDSTASNIIVFKGIHKQLNEEAIRLIRLAKWKPGEINRKQVRSYLTFPVEFK